MEIPSADRPKVEIMREKAKPEGKGWKWVTNYDPDDQNSREIISSIDSKSRRGEIKSWDASRPAYNQEGNPLEDLKAIYIQE